LRNEIATIPLIQTNIERIRFNLVKLNDEYNILLNQQDNENYEDINVKVNIKKEELKNSENNYNNSVQAHKIQSLINNLCNQIATISISDINEENIKNMENERNKLQVQLNDMKQMLISYKEYIKIKQELHNIILITTSEIIKSQIEILNESLTEYTDMYNKAYQMYSLMNDRSELERIRNTIIDLNVKSTNLNIMKNIIIETANIALQGLVDTINNMTNSILDDLFDSSIIVELKLYKELKTGKNKIKPSVNLSVYYEGNTYDNINSLSGGEQSRISLALTLALASIHTSPIVFLDEVMGALNEDLREECVEVIKKFLSDNNKLVINIEHNSIDGIYDDIVEVNK